MFTVSNIKKNPYLDQALSKLMNAHQFRELKDNGVKVVAYMYENSAPTDQLGKIQIATELEKVHGYDAVIYANSHWMTYAREIDVEAFVFQLLLSLRPMIVGKENTPVLKIDKDAGVIMHPDTVAKYGREISWYKPIFKEYKGEFRD